MTQQTRLTEHTLLVQALDMERLNADLTEQIHKAHPETSDKTYSILGSLAIVTEPKLAMFDNECIGTTSEPFAIEAYAEWTSDGIKHGECMPSYGFNVSLAELQPYVKGTKTLAEFMGNSYRPEHHRIGANIREWLRYFNNEE